MTKESLANQVNATLKGIGRTIALNYLEDYKVGDTITVEKAESWTNGGTFTVETGRKYEYFFICENEVNVHEVDYDNEEECEILDCQDCWDEKEVLVPAGTRFKIIEVMSDEAFGELGYKEIRVKRI